MAGSRGERQTNRERDKDSERQRQIERQRDRYTETETEEGKRDKGGEDTEFKQAAGLGREPSVTGEVSLEGVWRALSSLCQGF